MAERNDSKDVAVARTFERRSLDWSRISAEIASDGFARVPRLLARAECSELAALFDDEQHFRVESA